MAAEDLLEREAEVAALEAAIDAAAAGGGRVVLLEGAAGIGKSRLLADVRRRAPGRMRVLAARGGELEREFPFGVVRQLFEGALTDPQTRAHALTGAAAPAAPVFADIAGEGAGEGSFAILHALFWLVLNLGAQRPLLLAVDDLHWCDRPSLRFLAYLSRRLEDLPVLLVTTLRTAEPGTDPALLAELVHDPATDGLALQRLTPEGSAALVRSVLPAADDGFCATCHATTDGVPLLLRQLVRALEADGVAPVAPNAGAVLAIGPRAISRTVLSRLARLGADAVAVARAVAVLGESAALAHVAPFARLPETAVADAARELARAEILRSEAPLGFVHALVRHAVYDELTAAERQLEHARAATLLHEANAAPELVAGQLLLAPPGTGTWARGALEAAAAAAQARGAPDGAVGYLRRAVEEVPRTAAPADRAHLLLRLGRLEQEVDATRGVAHLREAHALLEDPAERARAAYVLVNTAAFVDAELALELVREALAELPEDLDDLRRALLALEAVCVFFGAGDPADVQWLAGLDGPVAADGFGARALEAFAGTARSVAGEDAQLTGDIAAHALSDGVLLREDSGLFWVAAANALSLADRVDDAAETFALARRNAHRRGSLFTALTVHLWEGAQLLRRGDLDAAAELLTTADEEIESWTGGARHTQGYGLGMLAAIRIEQGRLDEAERVLHRAGETTTASDGENFVRQGRLALALARGDATRALALAEDLAVHAARVRNPAWAPWRTLKAQCLHALGRTGEARALAEEELALAQRWGTASVVGRGLTVLGRFEGRDGLPRLEQAAALLQRSPARLLEAHALAALGTALRHDRRPTEARAPLRRALELAESCGATALRETVRTELHAAGARPRTTASSGPASLTPSERRVAGLAAEGQTNRDIAQALYVTPKTVEVHLSAAYRKLGVASRRQLPAVLAGAS
jgi:DNA-binding CsgD family transcriptional regulator